MFTIFQTYRVYARPAILLFFISILLLGCELRPSSVLVEIGLITPSPTPDPFVYQRVALQSWAHHDIERLGPLPQYHIAVQLSADSVRLSGQARVLVPNAGPEIIFRLYPNFDNYGGAMTVTQASIDGAPVTITPIEAGTAIRLLRPVIVEGQTLAMVELTFEVDLASRPGDSRGDYTLFGWQGSVLSLPGFYPALAVPQNGAWILDRAPPHGDVLFNEVALYQLDLTLTRDLVVVAGGVALNVIDNPNGTRTWQIAGGPLRDMSVMAGPFQAISENAAGAVVTSYYLPGHERVARTVLTHAAAALRLYSETFGPYPYTELNVVEAPLNVRGMEYTGLILIGEELYRQPREFLTFLVAHEVAHQWWYALVGNNPYQHPWLDEGLTEYTAFFYYRKVFGPDEAERLLTERWSLSFKAVAGGNIEGVVDRPVGSFDAASYELLAYTKAALFFNALHTELGEEKFLEVLRTYYGENRYKITTPAILLATAQRVSGQNLEPLAEAWLR